MERILPKDVILYWLGFLTVKELVCCSRINKYFKELVYTPSLWYYIDDINEDEIPELHSLQLSYHKWLTHYSMIDHFRIQYFKDSSAFWHVCGYEKKYELIKNMPDELIQSHNDVQDLEKDYALYTKEHIEMYVNVLNIYPLLSREEFAISHEKILNDARSMYTFNDDKIKYIINEHGVMSFTKYPRIVYLECNCSFTETLTELKVLINRHDMNNIISEHLPKLEFLALYYIPFLHEIDFTVYKNLKYLIFIQPFYSIKHKVDKGVKIIDLTRVEDLHTYIDYRFKKFVATIGDDQIVIDLS